MENKKIMYDLANDLIDYLIELNGLEWVIEYLFQYGLSYYELIGMGFDEIDVKKVASDMGKIL
jgi:hypothetical protein